ncbi:uracil-DNA glycosylase family protein [Hymenobacter psychrophilus]|uniref:Uracil-DNA glycosylase-like domain-containing protein n=1 Tax=Hymenobacter psychrophilus TaxID=651662 RepID=A0A1H3BR74_9BACT|nr:uracil-DNA glycosylase family protein [Hymenobacter psychrophilus]SDX43844.1 protein of unknown function [Hymenobacter psychrophilus]
MPFADRLAHFLLDFPLPPPLPDAVTAYSPYHEQGPRELFTEFARRYYAGNRPRVALLGINPGRLGNGRTGVAFTDGLALTAWGIAHKLPARREPSSEFMQAVVEAWGGPAAFYQQFYVGSLYPLVLLKDGRNYNYYDSPAITESLWPDMRANLQQLVAEVGLRQSAAVCLGRRNAKFFQRFNDELGLFEQLYVLDHPRYLMQYQRRHLAENVAHYVEVLAQAAGLA